MSNMFYSCYSLEEVSDLSGLYTKNLIRIDGMFRYCKSLETLDLSGFYTSNLTYLQELFSGCTNLREITGISNWNTSNVTNMAYVFADCSSLVTLDLSGWSTANVTSIYEMFYNCRSLKTVNVSSRWNTDKMAGNWVFYGCNSIVGGNGTVFSSSKYDYRYAHVDEEGNPGYLTYKKVIRIVEVADSDDTNCELIKIDDNTWQYVFSDMAPGLQYYAWEDKMDDYKSVNMLGSGDFEYAKAENGAAAITNTTTINPPTFGSIQVTKNVLNKDGTDITSAADKAKDFLFTVTLNDADNNPVADNTMFSAVKSAGGEESEISVIFKDGAASFRLADDESLSIVDVPTGYSYSVTETADEEYDTTYSDSTGAVEADTASVAAFVNKKNYEDTEDEYVTVRVKNTVTSNVSIDPAEEFPYTIYIDNLKPDTYYSMIKNGEEVLFKSEPTGIAFIEMTLVNGEEMNFTIPVGARYIVTDLAGEYVASYNITDDGNINIIKRSGNFNTEERTDLSTEKETANAGEEILIEFTNKRYVVHDLTIVKNVVGTSEENDDQFVFSISLSGLTPGMILESTIGNRHRVENDGTLLIEGFSLKNGESAVIYDIPVGVDYIVTEGKSSYVASYVIMYGDTEFTSDANTAVQKALSTGDQQIPADYDPIVVFTNTKIACDITVSCMIDTTYGILLKDEYSKTEFEYDFTLDQTDVPEESRLTYNEIIVRYTKENTTGADEMTLAKLLGMDETAGNETVNSKSFTVVLHHEESFTITNLPLSASCMVEQKRMANYYASYTTKTNEGAVLQAESQKENALKDTVLDITNPEKVDNTDRDIRFIFLNVYEFVPYTLPDSGTEDIRPILTFMLFGMMSFAALYYVANRNKKTR